MRIRDHLVALRNSVKTGRTSSNVRATKSRRNFSQQTHLKHPIGPETDISLRFVLFGCIRDCLVAFRNSVQNDRTCAKVRATKSRQNYSQRTNPIHPHWTLSGHFGAFHTISVHSGPFGCHTKLGAKQAELVQKFVPRSRVGIFRTRSTHLDPKLPF